MKISDTGYAWAAGLLEGEACFDIRPSNALKRDPDNKQARIIVVMTDLDVLERLKDIFGGNINEVKSPSMVKPENKTAYRWLLSQRSEVFNCLLHIRPYMLKRRGERCDELFEFLERKVVHEL